MIYKNAKANKATWMSIFRRKGGAGEFTRLFDDLSIQEQVSLRSKSAIYATEAPVIGSYRDAENWLILTTDRLVWSTSEGRQEVKVEAIRDANVDLQKLQRTASSKLENEELQILTRSADQFIIRVEPGPPLSGVWSVLRNIGARNRFSGSARKIQG